MEKRWYIKYIGNHWVGCSHTTPVAVLTRVIKLEMFWVLSMRLLVKNHNFHVFNKMFPEDTANYSFYKIILSKKYPARARRFITGGTSTHRHNHTDRERPTQNLACTHA